MEKHYVCKGECGGESDYSKKCGTKECSLYQRDLVECDCTDGKHHKEEE